VKAHRFSRGELDLPVTDDIKLRAAKEVKAFFKSDGGRVFQKLVDEYRTSLSDILLKRAEDVPHVAYAENSGAAKGAKIMMGFFDRIISDAERLENG
jgi:hypothetical protein